jgi:prophage antirepressor-like protein
MNDITIFNNPEFGDVRTIMIDGEPWFCGKDVAGNLGYVNEKNAVKRHCDDGEVLKQTLGVQTGIKKDGTPAIMDVEMFFVNESGLYSLIFGSKLESAKKFKKWVTSEVLPQLRKTGSYGTPKLPQTPMELLELHYEAIKQVDSKVNNLEERFNDFEQSLPLLPEDADDVSKEVKKRVVEVLGGKDSNAYHDKSLSQKVFMDAYRNLKSNFDVSSYKAIKRNRRDMAVQIAREYKPPLYLAEQIQAENAQMRFA